MVIVRQARSFSAWLRREWLLTTAKGDEAGVRICYRGKMFRFFNLLGRSPALNKLDVALRESGVHPVLVPEAVKLTIIRLCKRVIASGERSAESAYGEACQLLAFCMLGREHFIETNDQTTADAVERRLDAAIAAGDTLDAQIVLLALHAKLIDAEIADRFEVEER